MEGLATAVSRLGGIRSRFHTLEPGSVTPQTAEWETSNVLATASALASAALTRAETRGGHLRADYPERDDRWRVRLVATLNPDGNLHLVEAPLELG
jgi:L-aspartate oxidase